MVLCGIVLFFSLFHSIFTEFLTKRKKMKNNIPWVDLVRVVACFLVVFAHCVDPFVGNLDSNYTEFLTGAFWGSLFRSCVPLFVMISGVLLLPVKMDMNTFYRRRLSRVVFPLVVWSVLLPLLYFLYFAAGVQTLSPNIDMAAYTWDATVTKMATFIFNFNYATTPLWYIYMLVGLYLVMPIVSAWLTQASKKDVQTVLLLWLISTTLPYVQLLAPMLGYGGNFGNMGLLGVCDWNIYGMFYYFSGFLGYVILAYYLVRYPLEWSMRKTLAVAAPLFLVGYAITALGFIMTQKLYPGNFVKLEIIWLFSGTNVLLMTFSAFIVMQKIQLKPSRFLSRLASLTFGIYLCHFVLVQVAYDFIYPYVDIAAAFQLPLIAVVAFVLSALLVWLLSLLPGRKYTAGV